MSSTQIAVIGAPESVEDLGIRRALLEELALKTLFVLGEMSLRQLADHMRLNHGLVEDVFVRLRKDQLVEVTGLSGGIHRVVTVTAQGAGRAQQLLSLSQYVGPTPVSVHDYVARVRAQSVREVAIYPEHVQHAFDHLVLNPQILGRIGTAVVSGATIFLYGPAGTGKTSIAETMGNIFGSDQVWIPYAIEIDGQIISVFDPLTHHVLEESKSADHDRRWVLCRRPRVVVGGELTIDMLDLQFNPATKYYSAPVQMKANNGLLIIDDFGRQRIRPEELLNRWIVPLDRKIDFLTLGGGRKIEIPFDVFVVFATNIDPAELADEAFLRRIQTKIKIDALSDSEFHEIFRRVCAESEVTYDAAAVNAAIAEIRGRYGQELRPCQPRDLVHQICWQAKYLRKLPVLSAQSLADACHNYFVAA